jgi:hypothetical protein
VCHLTKETFANSRCVPRPRPGAVVAALWQWNAAGAPLPLATVATAWQQRVSATAVARRREIRAARRVLFSSHCKDCRPS